MLVPGIVVDDRSIGGQRIGFGDLDLMRKLSNCDDVDYRALLDQLWFVMPAPSSRDINCMHPMLPWFVFPDQPREALTDSFSLVISKVVWRADERTFALTGRTSWISESFLRSLSNAQDGIRRLIDGCRASPGEIVLTEADESQLLNSDQPDAKGVLLRHAGWTIEQLQRIEHESSLPDSDSLTDPEVRFSVYQSLKPRTWTLQVKDRQNIEGKVYFFASHPSFSSRPSEISGAVTRFPVEVGDVIVATIAVVPVGRITVKYRYRVVGAEIIKGAMTQQDFEHELLLLNAYTNAAEFHTLFRYVDSGESEFTSKLVDEDILTVEHLASMQTTPLPFAIETIQPSDIDQINRKVASRPWVFTAISDVKEDGRGHLLFRATNPAFIYSLNEPERRVAVSFSCQENVPVPGIGEPFIGWVLLASRESGVRIHVKQRWRLPPQTTIGHRNSSLMDVERAVRLLEADFFEKFDVKPGDLSKKFIESAARAAGKPLLKKLLAKKMIDAALGCELISAGQLSRDDVTNEDQSRWLQSVNAITLIRMVDVGLLELSDTLSETVRQLVLSDPPSEFVRWTLKHRSLLFPEGFDSSFARKLASKAEYPFIVEMISAGLLSPADVPSAPVRAAARMESRAVVQKWVEIGLLSWRDVPEKYLLALFQQAMESDPNSGARILKSLPRELSMHLVNARVAKVSDLTDKDLSDYICGLTFEELRQVAERDGLTRCHLTTAVRGRLLMGCRLFDLLLLVRIGLIDVSDIDEEKALQLILPESPLGQVLDAIQVGIFQPSAVHKYLSSSSRNPIFCAWVVEVQIDFAIRSIKLGLFKPDDFSAQRRKIFASFITAANAHLAVSCGLVLLEDIEGSLIDRLAGEAMKSSGLAANLCGNRLLSPSRIPLEIRLNWASNAPGTMLARLVDSGLLDQDVFAALPEAKKDQLLSATSTAWRLHAARVLPPEQLAGFLSAWLESNDVAGIKDCLRVGLVSPDAIPEGRTRQLFDIADPDLAFSLLEARLPLRMSEDRFDQLYRSWSVDKLLRGAVEFGMKAGMFSTQARSERAMSLLPEQAFRLVRSGCMLSSDLGNGAISKWIAEERLNRHSAFQLKKIDAFPPEFLSDKLRRDWMSETKRLSIALEGIKFGLYGWNDFAPNVKEALLGTAMAADAALAIQMGLVTKDDFGADQLQAFVAESLTDEGTHDSPELGLGDLK
jgi:hypothetical protein